MNNNTLLLTINNHIAMLTLNRPEIHNAFDDALIKNLTEQLQQLDKDPNVRVVLLTANGKSFSAGADMNWMQRMAQYSEQENLQDALAMARMMYALYHLSKPTIALVQGAAYGGGVGLVACCDIALATPQANFCLSEVKLGLIPAAIGPFVIAAIGERAARRYFLTAEKFDPQEAHRLGLIHQIVNENELTKIGQKLAENLLTNGPQAVTVAKHFIEHIAHQSIDQTVTQYSAETIAKLRVSPEAQEGLSAFLEKRKPKWTT
jgi:methylglutaconyl-CoA hydratase